MVAWGNTFCLRTDFLNQFYMAGSMTAPMVVIELVYANIVIVAVAVAALGGFFWGLVSRLFWISQQGAMATKRSLRSMNFVPTG